MFIYILDMFWVLASIVFVFLHRNVVGEKIKAKPAMK